MSINHLGEFLVRFESLPLQAGTPVLEESPRPSFAVVVPELTEGLLEQIGRVQAFIGRQQRLEGMPTFKGEIFAVREQGVFLPFDEAAVTTTEPRIFTFSYRVQRLSKVAHDVKFIKEDRCLRRMRHGCVAKWLPHIHHRQANASAFLPAKPLIEHRHARLRAILATEPDRAPANQIAHHDSVGVALADRDLVDPDRLGSGCACLGQLGTHVLHFKFLDRMPIQTQLLGNILDRGTPAASPYIESKALGIKGVVGQERQMLAFHLATNEALHASYFELEINVAVGTGQIANLARAAVVPTRANVAAATTCVFFERRTSVMTRAFGSPKTPRTVCSGRKPRNAYASHSRRFRLVEFAIQTSCQVSAALNMPETQYPCGFQPYWTSN